MQRYYSNPPQVAGFFVRLAAFAIDNICMMMVLLIIRISVMLFFRGLGQDANGLKVVFEYSLMDICLYLGLVLYFILVTYCTGGRTIGKRLLNLQVVNTAGTKLSLFTVIYRETIGRFLSGLFLSIGYIIIGVDKEKRALHDFICDTRVIYTIPSPIIVQEATVLGESEISHEAQ